MATPKAYTGPWFAYPNAGQIASAAAIFLVLNVVVVGLRFYIRSWQKTKYGVDDWLVLPALAMIVGMNISLLYGISHKAIGYPSPPNNVTKAGNGSPAEVLIAQIAFAFTIMMILAYGCIKLSALFFYRRLFVLEPMSKFGVVTMITIVLVALWTVAFLLNYIFGCGKYVTALWGNVLLAADECPNGFKNEMALFASDLATDLIVLLLPVPVIWNLQMQLSRKVSVTAVLMLGAMAIAASITRGAIYAEIDIRGYDPYEDINLGSSATLYWSTIEAGLGLFATCLPSLQPLLRRRSLDSIVRSVRSIISLRSVPRSQKSASGRSGSESNAHLSDSQNGLADENTGGKMRKDQKASLETYEMWALEGDGRTAQSGTIHVNRDFQLSENRV